MTDQTKTYSLTLTRWHKVAQRIQKEMTRLEGIALEKIALNLSLAARTTAKESVVAETALAVEQIGLQCATLNDSLVEIRVRLGRANTEHGVSDLLAKVDGLNRIIRIGSSLCAVEAAKQLSFADYKAMDIPAPTSDMMGRVRGGAEAVKVKVLSAERLAAAQQDLLGLQRQVHALSDDIADLNRKQLSIALPDIAAQAAGIDGTGA